MRLKRGMILEDRYEIDREVGRGGMSIVWRAQDKKVGRGCAIKEVLLYEGRKAGRNEENVQKLRDEGDMLKNLDHPSLIRIHDIIDKGDTVYVVEDFVEGESLHKVLSAHGAQPQETVLEWAKQICEVLIYLHTQNPPIIYRDLKPGNIMLRPEGDLKLIDFGIAQENKVGIGVETNTLGSEGYAPPEQRSEHRRSDARTDIYSLGIVIYELLVGKGPSDVDMQVKPVRMYNPAVSAGLESIIKKCIAIDPNDRYQSAAELLYALEHYQEADADHKKAQKRKLISVVIPLVLSVVMLISGLLFQGLKKMENDKDYENLLNSASSDADYGVKLDNYRTAISIYPERTEAYQQLIKAIWEEVQASYDENGTLLAAVDKDCTQDFTELYNANSSALGLNKATLDEDVLDLHFEAGELIFFDYGYNSYDTTHAARAMRARSYFERVVNQSSEAYQKTDEYRMAVSYYNIGEFYATYVMSTFDKEMPEAQEVSQLLTDFENCLEAAKEESETRALTMCNQLIAMMNNQASLFARTSDKEGGVAEEEMLELFDRIVDYATHLAAEDTIAQQKQEALTSDYPAFRENIIRAYDNA